MLSIVRQWFAVVLAFGGGSHGRLFVVVVVVLARDYDVIGCDFRNLRAILVVGYRTVASPTYVTYYR
jgi:hypothetical protein